jgi:hypothetical protein
MGRGQQRDDAASPPPPTRPLAHRPRVRRLRGRVRSLAGRYGGFQTGFGIFLVVCALRPAWLEPGLWAGALALGGFGTFRLLSLLLGDGPVGAPIYVGLSIELGGALLNVLALRSAAARG